MRHRKDTLKLGRTSSHNRCMFANMLKSLIEKERMVTTVTKAKELRRHADKMISLAKKNRLIDRRRARGKLMLRYDQSSLKEFMKNRKEVACADYPGDRGVLHKLFDVLGPRFSQRKGGYTRLIRLANRCGDNAPTCIIEFLAD